MVKLVVVKCRQCGHEWKPREEVPKRCRRCGSYNWDKQPRRIGTKGAAA
jgi:predicted Zn-ribbon and HTH transcriptional regulator